MSEAPDPRADGSPASAEATAQQDTTRQGATGVAERVAWLVHALHGTRSLLASAVLLLLLSLIETALTARLLRSGLIIVALLLLVNGLATLAREGAVAEEHVRHLLDRPDARQAMARRLVWPVLLLVLLLPRFFLAVYGIPHLNPLTGLVLPSIQRRITLVYLLIVVLVPIIYMRVGRRYAPHVAVPRPKQLADDDPAHGTRNALLLACGVLVPIWLLLMRPFWAPFSLLAWPPGLASLASVRGVAALSYTLAVPVPLFMVLSGHLGLLRELHRRNLWGARWDLAALGIAHIVFTLVAVALHGYDILWVVRYEAGARF